LPTLAGRIAVRDVPCEVSATGPKSYVLKGFDAVGGDVLPSWRVRIQ